MLAAPVSGFAAYVFAKVLEDSLPARLVMLQHLAEQGRVHPALVAEVGGQWAAVREAGRQWAEHRSVADSSTAEQVAAIPKDSSEIDTSRAADLLGVSPNRVRQLARGGSLPGRKASGAWLVDRVAVELRREQGVGSLR